MSGDRVFAVLGKSQLAIATIGRLEAVAPSKFVEPVVDETGVIRIPVPATGLAFDSRRNLVWGVVPADGGELANSAFSLDPVTGKISSSTPVGSNPLGLTINSDASRVYTVLAGSQAIGGLDLNTNQPLAPFRVGDPAELLPSHVIALSDSPNSVAVIRSYRQGPYVSDVAIFDDSVRRGTSYPEKISNSLATVYSQSLSNLYASDGPGILYGAQTQLEGGDSSNRVVRLVVDASGVRLDKELPPLVLGTPQFGRQIAVDRGSLYTGGGQVVTADLETLEGRFELAQSYAAGGVPLVLPDRNQVAYVHGSFITRTGVALTLFDLTSRRPVATVPLPLELSFRVVAAVVRAGDSIVVAGSGQVLVVPIRSIPPIPEFRSQPESIAPGVTLIRLPVRRMKALPRTDRFIASVPSRAGGVGNTVVVVDPSSGRIVQSVFAGSEPAQLQVSPDGTTAYTFAEGERRLAVIDLQNGLRSALYPLDPEGKNRQFAIVDMAFRPGGGIAASFGISGGIALFDGPNPSATPFLNDRGSAGFVPGFPFLLFNEDGTRIYSYSDFLSIRALNRLAVSPDGIRWLSSNANLPIGSAELMRQSKGLIYTYFGFVIDPEMSRVVGRYSISSSASSVLPDPDSNRVFFLVDGRLLMFDMQSRALLGSLTFPRSIASSGSELIRLGPDKVAFRSPSEDAVVIVSVDAIPLFPSPVPSLQPALPSTPDVSVIDLAAAALAYDPARNRLYASTPNREASRGDQVFAIDLATNAIGKSWHTGNDPRQVALSADSARLFVSSGFLGSDFASGFSSTSSFLRTIDPDAEIVGEPFPSRKPVPGLGFRTVAMVPLRDSPRTIAVLEGSTQAAGSATFSYGFDSLRIYDNGDPRPGVLGPNAVPCFALADGGSPGELLCASPSRLHRLRVDSNGVSNGPSAPLLLGQGEFSGIAVAKNRMFTSTGVVFDLSANRNLTRLETKGHVVTDGEFVAWVDTWTVTRDKSVFTLRVFDAATLAPRVTKEITITSSAFSAAVACGAGCVAFSSGSEIYVARF